MTVHAEQQSRHVLVVLLQLVQATLLLLNQPGLLFEAVLLRIVVGLVAQGEHGLIEGLASPLVLCHGLSQQRLLLQLLEDGFLALLLLPFKRAAVFPRERLRLLLATFRRLLCLFDIFLGRTLC